MPTPKPPYPAAFRQQMGELVAQVAALPSWPVSSAATPGASATGSMPSAAARPVAVAVAV